MSDLPRKRRKKPRKTLVKRERRSVPAVLKVCGWLNLVGAVLFAILIVFAPIARRYLLESAFMLAVAGAWGVLSIGLLQGRRWAVVMLAALLPLSFFRLLFLFGDGDATPFSVLGFLFHAAATGVGLANWRRLPRSEGTWRPHHAAEHPFEQRAEPAESREATPQDLPQPPPLPRLSSPTLWAIDTPGNRAVAARVVGGAVDFPESAAWVEGGLLPVVVRPADDVAEGAFPRGVAPLATFADLLDGAGEPDAETRIARGLPYVLSLCQTLGVAHAYGVVLRQLRPDRVALLEDGVAVILDWSPALVGEATTAGSPWASRLEAWRAVEDLRASPRELPAPVGVAPELLEDPSGVADRRADVYALGALLHQLLTGWPPYEAQSLDELVAKAKRGPAPLAPHTPDALAELCARCLASDPEARPVDAAAVAAIVEGCLQPAPSAAPPREAVAPVERNPALAAEKHRLVVRRREVARHAREAEHRSRRRLPLAVALASVLAAAVGFSIAAILLPRGEDAETSATGPAEAPTSDPLLRPLGHYGELGRRELLAERAEVAIPYLLAEYGLSNETPALRFLLARACLPVGDGVRMLRGHEDDVDETQFDLTGRYLVTASRDGTARLWDARSGTLVRPLTGHTGPVHGACFDSEGIRVATAGADGTVRVWDAVTGTPGVTLRGHEGSVLDVAFSPGGTRLLTVGADGTLRAWNAQDGRLLTKLDAHERPASVLRVSPEGSRVATSGADGLVTLRDAGSGDSLSLRQETKQRAVSLITFSADGRRLAATGTDGTVRVWDARRGGSPVIFEGHEAAVTDVRFDPSGMRLATASGDRTARVWDVVHRREILRLEEHQGAVRAVSWSPDGTLLLTAAEDGIARVWDAASGLLLDTISLSEAPLLTAHFHPEGSRAVVTGKGGGAWLIDVHLERRSYGALRAWAAECIPWSLERGELVFTELRADRKRAQRVGAESLFEAAEPSARLRRSPPSVHLDSELALFAPSVVPVGETFEVTVVAWNTGERALSDVAVAVRGSEGLRLLGRETARVTIPVLEPGVRHTVHAVYVAEEAGEYQIDASVRDQRGWAASGAVAKVMALAPETVRDARAEVVLPLRFDVDLVLKVEPSSTLVGSPFSALAQVTNTGTGSLTELTVAVRGGEGLSPVGGEEARLSIARLDPGETREIRGRFVADRGGSVRIDASVRTRRGWAAAGAFCPIEVTGLSAIQMELVDLSLDDRRQGIFEEGEDFRYVVEVANDHGTGATEKLYVIFRLPPELTFVSGEGDGDLPVEKKGPYFQSASFSLTPKERRRITIVVRAVGVPPGNLLRAEAAVLAFSGSLLAQETESTTIIPSGGGRNVPAIELEMKDAALDGAEKGIFEKGESFLYVVAVRNDGSDVPTPKLRAVFTLPPELAFVSGRGDRGVEVMGEGASAMSTAFVVAKGQVQYLEIVVRGAEVPAPVASGRVRVGVLLEDAEDGSEYASEEESTTLVGPRGAGPR